jgi:hypothetical protein
VERSTLDAVFLQKRDVGLGSLIRWSDSESSECSAFLLPPVESVHARLGWLKFLNKRERAWAKTGPGSEG